MVDHGKSKVTLLLENHGQPQVCEMAPTFNHGWTYG